MKIMNFDAISKVLSTFVRKSDSKNPLPNFLQPERGGGRSAPMPAPGLGRPFNKKSNFFVEEKFEAKIRILKRKY